MKIMVTGGSGLIGSYLLREFKRYGYTLSSYCRSKPIENYAEWIEGDIKDSDRLKAACEGHDAIIHLAAVAGPGRATTEELLNLNVMGTVNVLEVAVDIGIKRFVFASSGAATGFSFQSNEIIPEYLPLDEEHPCTPQDEYGMSKLLGEQACKHYSSRYGLQTICLRINHNWCLDREGTNIAVQTGWAKGLTVDKLWQNRYRKVIEDPEGDWPQPGPPSPRNLLWAVTDIRDTIQAFRLAIENTDILHEVFQINADDTCSTTETHRLIAQYFPHVPIRHSFKNYETLISHSKAKRILGYRPQHTWRDSDFIHWLKNYNSKV